MTLTSQGRDDGQATAPEGSSERGKRGQDGKVRM